MLDPIALMWLCYDMRHGPLKDARNLPALPGVYVVYLDEQILYIGKTKNLQHRWKGHHRHEEFATFGKDVELAWAVLTHEAADLAAYESALITLLQPALNGQRYKPERLPSRKPKTVGDLIRAYRTCFQWSLADLARTTGISRITLSAYECNQITNVPSYSIMALARAFGVEAGALYPKQTTPEPLPTPVGVEGE